SDMVDTSRVEIGDAIVGLPANGLHTNGYSLARRVLPPQRFGDRLNGETIGDALLAVHPCYLPSIDALREAGVTIKAMAHITGGGLIENVPRVLPDHAAARFDRSTWTVPAIEALIVREAGLAGDEPYRVLNMGVGFCIIVRREDARRAVDAVAHGQPPLAASIVGDIEPRHSCGPAVIIS
ncbi:MAG TPA: AIR synthase-related protein, partial [Candidatus Eremiobacteraceae bacterium]|nr:AIR synthase-related protein [Candidatus Eremiobacteraceae bacterium]